jgi:hypothetical protein
MDNDYSEFAGYSKPVPLGVNQVSVAGDMKLQVKTKTNVSQRSNPHSEFRNPASCQHSDVVIILGIPINKDWTISPLKATMKFAPTMAMHQSQSMAIADLVCRYINPSNVQKTGPIANGSNRTTEIPRLVGNDRNPTIFHRN